MKTKLLLLFSLFLFVTDIARAQYWTQYFDGGDTLQYPGAIQVQIDTSQPHNIWQIGRRQKVIFDSAATRPNALVTDTVAPYPVNDSSIVTLTVPYHNYFYGIMALQWMQKLDMDSGRDGGILEYQDTGGHWINAFNNPVVHNFYGFNLNNKVQLPSGEWAFSGRDTVWRDIWFCIGFNYGYIDTPRFRFRLSSDSIGGNGDGWMIDNMSYHMTFVHPVKEVDKDPFLKVYPRLTNGTIYIQAKDPDHSLRLADAELVDEQGRTVQKFALESDNTHIDIGDHPNGWYILRVNSSLKAHSYNIMLKREK